mgnify:CR=1 FL=1
MFDYILGIVITCMVITTACMWIGMLIERFLSNNV